MISPRSYARARTRNIILVAGVVSSLSLVAFVRFRMTNETTATKPLATAEMPSAVPIVPSAPLSEPVRDVRILVAIQSSAPKATVHFRGQDHPCPYREEIFASKTPEAIEVTAPNKQGRRYWFKFNQERTLQAVLSEGSGIVDATFEETEKALRDEKAPASPGTSMTLAPSPTRLSAAPARMPPPPVEPPHAPPRPSVVATPATSESPPPEKPPPVAALTPPRPAPGTIEPKAVRAAVFAHSGEVQACYDRARMEPGKQDMRGRVAVSAQIAANGSVASVGITSSTAGSSRLDTCLVNAFRSWTFPQPAGGVPGSVAYTFVFE